MVDLAALGIRKGSNVLKLIDELLEWGSRDRVILFDAQADDIEAGLRGVRRRTTSARPEGMTVKDWVDTAPRVGEVTYRGVRLVRKSEFVSRAA